MSDKDKKSPPTAQELADLITVTSVEINPNPRLTPKKRGHLKPIPRHSPPEKERDPGPKA